jgi:hypothetical protein
LRVLAELLRVAVDRDDTYQLPTGYLESATVEPSRLLHSPEPDEPSGFRVDVIGLEVQVVSRPIIDGLHRRHQPRDRVRQRGELLLALDRLGLDPDSRGPEFRGTGCLVMRYVDEQSGDAAAMHSGDLRTSTGRR